MGFFFHFRTNCGNYWSLVWYSFTNHFLCLELDEEDDDSKPRPPEDDSVPDMEDSFTGDGVGPDEVEEYINNISNDEVKW